MKTLLTILPSLLSIGLSCTVATATMQRQDYLEFESKLFRFGTYGDTPLEEYFRRNPGSRPKEFKAECSNLWRGHIAHWRVTQNKLWLVSIYIRDDSVLFVPAAALSDMVIYPIQNIFHDPEPSVFADWFSGEIQVTEDPTVENLVNPNRPQEAHTKRLCFQKGVLVMNDGQALTDYTSNPTFRRWIGWFLLLLIPLLIALRSALRKWRRRKGEQIAVADRLQHHCFTPTTLQSPGGKARR
jgi:hypothetical protein